ncbi:hypothetical protein CEXT_493211 [Caerostris extrusa]|uniref:Uncharacterized protein n=1 Tax=Caerostris extrusa TaxID=172846 RepID=A0AAV4VZN2_CAEEX|nr:hypothetical protein CEXT_493211 [Caerostris extrusa]
MEKPLEKKNVRRSESIQCSFTYKRFKNSPNSRCKEIGKGLTRKAINRLQIMISQEKHKKRKIRKKVFSSKTRKDLRT